VVHQIRNSLKYVASKDQKLFLSELKPVYRADNESVALDELAKLKEKWGKKFTRPIRAKAIIGKSGKSRRAKESLPVIWHY
jgi:putative transposase